MNNYTIGITTFSNRYHYIVKLLSQIRKFTDKKIVLIVNGEKNGEFDDDYRNNILLLSAKYSHVYPIFFIETRGLSKLWNTALINSYDDNLLLLNDDLEIHSSDIFDKVDAHINTNNFNGITKINNSFSHFIVNKTVIDSIGYFDERLIGFGEEDGDITYQLLKIGLNINNLFINGVINIVSNVRHEHIKSGIGKYSHFNREFIYNQKYEKNLAGNLRGMFDTPMNQILNNIKQYPYENFFRENKTKL